MILACRDLKLQYNNGKPATSSDKGHLEFASGAVQDLKKHIRSIDKSDSSHNRPTMGSHTESAV